MIEIKNKLPLGVNKKNYNMKGTIKEDSKFYSWGVNIDLAVTRLKDKVYVDFSWLVGPGRNK